MIAVLSKVMRRIKLCRFNYYWDEFSVEPYLSILKIHLRGHTSYSQVWMERSGNAKRNYSSEVLKRLDIVNSEDSALIIIQLALQLVCRWSMVTLN